ncbi:MAG: glycosyltransferase family 4 protein [Pseudomonadota bacterium]
MTETLQLADQPIAPGTLVKPLTVLQIAPALSMGGRERTTHEVAVALRDAGGRALIVAPQTPAALRLRASGAELTAMGVDTASPLRQRSNIRALISLIRRERVDVVHARSRAGALIASKAAATAGVGFVTTWDCIHGPDNFFTRPLTKALSSGRPVIAVSDFIARHLAEDHGLYADRVVTIPRGADMDVFAEEVVSPARAVHQAQAIGLAEDPRPVILSPGRMVEGKGRRVLIAAAARLKTLREAADFSCVIVGDGDPAHAAMLEEEIMRAGAGDVVRVAGPVSDMAAALKLSAIVVAPSTAPETAARVIIEAQAMGRPVVGTNHGAMPDMMKGGESGWLIPPGDVEALATALSEALDMDESARAHIGVAGRALVRSRYTLATMLAETMAVYEQAAGRTDPR